MNTGSLKNQIGFTLIELLAVMAIVATLAGIVSVAVTGSGETSRDTSIRQDAHTVESAASDYFSDQEGAEVLTPKTVDVFSATGVVQQISSRWPEDYITEVYPGVFDVRTLSLLTGDDGLSNVTVAELLTNFNAIDFDKLIDGGLLEVEPDSAAPPSPEVPPNAIWLLQKTTEAGGSSAGASRQVAAFKLVSVIEDEITDDIDVIFEQLVGEFTPATIPQLVDNGSFEDGTHGGVINELVGAGDTDITPWTIVSGNIDWILPLWDASDGVLSIDLNGNAPGEISQSFDTVAGRQYEVLFDMAGNPAYTGVDDIVTMEVSAAGQTTEYNFDISDSSLIAMGWQEKSFVFTATDTTTTLVFESTTIDDQTSGPTLDNVRVDRFR